MKRLALVALWLTTASCLPRGVRKGPAFPEAEATDFPDHVSVKTPTRTFNRFFSFALDADGRIWMKSIPGASPETDAVAPDWDLVLDTGLPHDDHKPGFVAPKRITSINADQDELMAVSDEHRHYSLRWFENP